MLMASRRPCEIRWVVTVISCPWVKVSSAEQRYMTVSVHRDPGDCVHVDAGHQSLGNQVGEIGQFIRPEDGKDGAADRADQRDDDGRDVFLAESVQLFQPGGREFALSAGHA